MEVRSFLGFILIVQLSCLWSNVSVAQESNKNGADSAVQKEVEAVEQRRKYDERWHQQVIAPLRGVGKKIVLNGWVSLRDDHDENLLMEKVKLKCRMAGIEVLPDELFVYDSYPLLRFSWSVFDPESGRFASVGSFTDGYYHNVLCSLCVSFQESARLVRFPLRDSIRVSVWDETDRFVLGQGDKEKVSEIVLKRAEDLVDKFLNDYLEANPK